MAILGQTEALELYTAIQVLRDFRRTAALLAPTVDIVAPQFGAGMTVAVEFEPLTEHVLSMLFEAVSAMEKHAGREEQRAAMEYAIRNDVDRKLKERFG